jgi:hypothetical protein
MEAFNSMLRSSAALWTYPPKVLALDRRARNAIAPGERCVYRTRHRVCDATDMAVVTFLSCRGVPVYRQVLLQCHSIRISSPTRRACIATHYLPGIVRVSCAIFDPSGRFGRGNQGREI